MADVVVLGGAYLLVKEGFVGEFGHCETFVVVFGGLGPIDELPAVVARVFGSEADPVSVTARY